MLKLPPAIDSLRAEVRQLRVVVPELRDMYEREMRRFWRVYPAYAHVFASGYAHAKAGIDESWAQSTGLFQDAYRLALECGHHGVRVERAAESLCAKEIQLGRALIELALNDGA